MAHFENKRSVGERLFGLYWHEAYRTGHSEYQHPLAAKENKVVGSCLELAELLDVDDSPHLWWGKCPSAHLRTVVRREHLC